MEGQKTGINENKTFSTVLTTRKRAPIRRGVEVKPRSSIIHEYLNPVDLSGLATNDARNRATMVSTVTTNNNKI